VRGLSEGLVPATDKVVAKVRARFGGELKYAFSGGAAIPPRSRSSSTARRHCLMRAIPTETSLIATANPNNRKIGSVGVDLVKVSISERRSCYGNVGQATTTVRTRTRRC
jgi:long-chain acyl-CoA synthetase